MKKKLATIKTLTTLIGLCLISFLTCKTNNSKQIDKLEHETNVFFWYADSIKLHVPEEPHTFIIIPNTSCCGCAKKMINVIFPKLENSTLITTSSIAKAYLNDSYNVYIDTLELIDKLNWDLGNIIEIKTRHKKVTFTKSYSADDMISLN